MPFRKLGVAIAALLIATAPVAAQAPGTEQRDARCVYVKSAILGRLLQADEPDRELINGVTTHVLYYFGRLDAVLDRPAISDLILAEALKFETLDDVIAAEEACDAPMEATVDFMGLVGDRLTAAGR